MCTWFHWFKYLLTYQLLKDTVKSQQTFVLLLNPPPPSSLFCAVPAFKVAIYHEKPLFLHRSRAQGTTLKVLGFQELQTLTEELKWERTRFTNFFARFTTVFLWGPLRRSRKEGPFYITRKRRSFCNLTAQLASPAREANFSVVVSRRIRLAESKKPGWLARSAASMRRAV